MQISPRNGAAAARTPPESCYANAMIRGLHGLFYSSDADATRAFMRDALRLPFSDVGGGWLIFDLPESDIGVHPIDEGGGPPANTHDVSFYCDDIHGTVADLRARGVEFKSEPQDHGYGWVTHFTMPGGVEVQLYEPKYEKRAGSKPAAKEGAAKKQAAQKPAAKAATKQAARKPATKQAAAKQPATKQAARKPATKQAATKPASRKAAARKPSKR
jgi:predicted enzyme related to lactoylglutathione lyase